MSFRNTQFIGPGDGQITDLRTLQILNAGIHQTAKT